MLVAKVGYSVKTKFLGILYCISFGIWFVFGMEFPFGEEGCSSLNVMFNNYNIDYGKPDSKHIIYCNVVFVATLLWIIAFVFDWFLKYKKYDIAFTVASTALFLIYVSKIVVLRPAFAENFGVGGVFYVIGFIAMLLFVISKATSLIFTKTS